MKIVVDCEIYTWYNIDQLEINVSTQLRNSNKLEDTKMPIKHNKLGREEFKLKTIKMLLAEDSEDKTDALCVNKDIIYNGCPEMKFEYKKNESKWFIYEDSLMNIDEFSFSSEKWCFTLKYSLGEFKLLPTKFGYIEIWM